VSDKDPHVTIAEQIDISAAASSRRRCGCRREKG